MKKGDLPAPLYKLMPVNSSGRDFVVGDINGCWHMLKSLMTAVDFDPVRDRIFSTGDMGRYGPMKVPSGHLAEKPWFHPVLGRFEIIQLLFSTGMMHLAAGRPEGFWHDLLVEDFRSSHERERLLSYISRMPVALEVPLPDGRRIGVVHCGVAGHAWADVRQIQPAISGPHFLDESPLVRSLLWDTTAGYAISLSAMRNSPQRLREEDIDVQLGLMEAVEPILDIDYLISGRVRTAKTRPIRCNNRILLNTGPNWLSGRLSIVELGTFRYWTIENFDAYPEPPTPKAVRVLVGDPRRLWISPEELRSRSSTPDESEEGP